MRNTGSYITSTTLGEPVRAFVPLALPPKAPLLDEGAYADNLAAARVGIGRLNAVSGLVQSVTWLVYAAIRKEALLTSQIEGTQATVADLFDVEGDFSVANEADVEEVTNYLRAFEYTHAERKRKNGLPLSVRLLCEAHRKLMTGVRGSSKQPRQIRRSQNWIGGTRPGNAVFVPAPPDKVPALLGALEKFIHGNQKIDPLVKVALVHAQFETIHPFLDSNGRIGRLLIAMMMESYDVMDAPVLFLSSFLKRHQAEYYRCLGIVRTQGDWETWINFFLEAVAGAAQEAERTIIDIQTIINNDRAKLLASANLAPATYRLFERLTEMPRFTVEGARGAIDTSFPTANAAIRTLVELGIVKELTGQRKNRGFGYEAYIERLAR
jgi:Fic family protein